jgi:hypothetical protein
MASMKQSKLAPKRPGKMKVAAKPGKAAAVGGALGGALGSMTGMKKGGVVKKK